MFKIPFIKAIPLFFCPYLSPRTGILHKIIVILTICRLKRFTPIWIFFVRIQCYSGYLFIITKTFNRLSDICIIIPCRYDIIFKNYRSIQLVFINVIPTFQHMISQSQPSIAKTYRFFSMNPLKFIGILFNFIIIAIIQTYN